MDIRHRISLRIVWFAGIGLFLFTSLGKAQPSSCSVPSPGTYCGVSVGISPFVTGGPFGGFQSRPGTGASVPISVTFSPPVASVSVTALDPDFPGNRMDAFDTAGGLVSSAPFAGDGTPGVFTTSTVTLTGGGIARVVLVPAPADFVVYDGLSFTPSGGTLAVQCTPASVVRGEPVQCRASVSGGGGSLEVTRWQFNGGGLLHTESLTSAITWEGPAVAGGTVQVEGRINGLAASASTSFTVTRRNWSGRQARISVQEPPATDLPLRPTVVGKLGHIHLERAGISGFRPDGTPLYVQVMSGPNTGFLYWDDVPVVAELIVHVNRAALTVGSDFWRQQPSLKPSPDRCSRADIEPFVPVVLDHEGIGFGPRSHAGLYRAEVNRRVGPAMEDIVTPLDLSSLFDQSEARWLPIQRAAQAESDRADTEFIPVYCSFRFF